MAAVLRPALTTTYRMGKVPALRFIERNQREFEVKPKKLSAAQRAVFAMVHGRAKPRPARIAVCNSREAIVEAGPTVNTNSSRKSGGGGPVPMHGHAKPVQLIRPVEIPRANSTPIDGFRA